MRDKNIDSVKGVLITLVVLGHVIEPYISNPVARWVYVFIYSFHMPAFIFLAGMLSGHCWDKCNASALKFIGLLLVFSVIYEGVVVISNGRVSDYARHLAPYWILWFLLSLAFWRWMTPLLLRLRWPVTSSLVISVCALGLFDIGLPLSLARTFSFLPFYVLGLAHGRSIIRSIRANNRALALGAVGLAVAFMLSQTISLPMLYGSYSFERMGLNLAIGTGYRLYAYVVCTITMLSAIAVSLQTDRLSGIGIRSLQIYLFHGLVVGIL